LVTENGVKGGHELVEFLGGIALIHLGFLNPTHWSMGWRYLPRYSGGSLVVILCLGSYPFFFNLLALPFLTAFFLDLGLLLYKSPYFLRV
jgi:hypothetical protein